MRSYKTDKKEEKKKKKKCPQKLPPLPKILHTNTLMVKEKKGLNIELQLHSSLTFEMCSQKKVLCSHICAILSTNNINALLKCCPEVPVLYLY